MKKILLFSLLLFIIPTLIIFYFFRTQENVFHFSSHTMVRILRTETGKIDVIPLEEYVVGVVAGEMPVSFHKEALKAQAVASRTYVMYQISKNQNKDYDVVDTVLNQVYLDSDTLKDRWKEKYDENYQKIIDSVLETAYEYIVYDDKIIQALFFSTSTGYTENSEEVFSSKLPYLRSVKSTWDSISPAFEEVETVSKTDFLQKLGLPFTDTISIKILEKTSAGRVNSIEINDKKYTGSEIVALFNLKSRCFTITVGSDSITLKTKGYGHGVGMSQYGAEGMAQEGYSYSDIIKYYYTGVDIKKIKT